ncbi:protein of unknown function [Cyanobium sp. NIES-981]|nr:protein of unknown function [Cyanobium sp. NIES-981]
MNGCASKRVCCRLTRASSVLSPVLRPSKQASQLLRLSVHSRIVSRARQHLPEKFLHRGHFQHGPCADRSKILLSVLIPGRIVQRTDPCLACHYVNQQARDSPISFAEGMNEHELNMDMSKAADQLIHRFGIEWSQPGQLL